MLDHLPSLLATLATAAAEGAHSGSTSWLADLLRGATGGSLPLALAITISIGVALGHLRIFGISLGITTVLFVGIAWSYVFWDAESIKHQKETLTFVREFGLVLFVYCLGMQVGPGFVASLRSQGLRWNALAAATVVLGLAVTAAIAGIFFGLMDQAWAAPQTMIGTMSGAITNTPGLSAASTALGDLIKQGYGKDLSELTAVAYAVAYPFGVTAIILALLFIRKLFRIDLKKEGEAYIAELNGNVHSAVNRNIKVTHQAAVGKTVEELQRFAGPGVVISRAARGSQVVVPSTEFKVQLDDLLHAVGSAEDVEKLTLLVGEEIALDVRTLTKEVGSMEIIVTGHEVVGVPMSKLDFPGTCSATITRIRRAGKEVIAGPDTTLHFGDRVTAVGDTPSLKRLVAEIGNSETDLRKPQIIALFFGIAVGVLIGQIPIPVPGLPVPVKLGLAGGPLVAALVFAHIGHLGKHINFFIAKSANNLLREFGIALFLACVGLLAGEKFVAAAFSLRGLWWILGALAITLIPLVLLGVIGRAVFKINYVPLSGLMAGSCTDPPALAFANQQTGNESPAIAYATVYPMTMLLRIVGAQIFVLIMVPLLLAKPVAVVPTSEPAKVMQSADPAPVAPLK